MKNAVIVILALLCGFLGWKAFHSSKEQTANETNPKPNGSLLRSWNPKDYLVPWPIASELMDKTPGGTINIKVTIGLLKEILSASGGTDDDIVVFTPIKYHSSKTELTKFYLRMHKLDETDITLINAVKGKSSFLISFKDANKDMDYQGEDESKMFTVNGNIYMLGKICPPPSGSCP